MNTPPDDPRDAPGLPAPTPRPTLTAAAERALAEAHARKSAPRGTAADEIGGRGGLEPTRYGDWEIKGLTSDF